MQLFDRLQLLEYKVIIQKSKELCILSNQKINVPSCLGSAVTALTNAVKAINCTDGNNVECVSCDTSNSRDCFYVNYQMKCSNNYIKHSLFSYLNNLKVFNSQCEVCASLDNRSRRKNCGYLHSHYTDNNTNYSSQNFINSASTKVYVNSLQPATNSNSMFLSTNYNNHINSTINVISKSIYTDNTVNSEHTNNTNTNILHLNYKDYTVNVNSNANFISFSKSNSSNNSNSGNSLQLLSTKSKKDIRSSKGGNKNKLSLTSNLLSNESSELTVRNVNDLKSVNLQNFMPFSKTYKSKVTEYITFPLLYRTNSTNNIAINSNVNSKLNSKSSNKYGKLDTDSTVHYSSSYANKGAISYISKSGMNSAINTEATMLLSNTSLYNTSNSHTGYNTVTPSFETTNKATTSIFKTPKLLSINTINSIQNNSQEHHTSHYSRNKSSFSENVILAPTFKPYLLVAKELVHSKEVVKGKDYIVNDINLFLYYFLSSLGMAFYLGTLLIMLRLAYKRRQNMIKGKRTNNNVSSMSQNFDNAAFNY